MSDITCHFKMKCASKHSCHLPVIIYNISLILHFSSDTDLRLWQSWVLNMRKVKTSSKTNIRPEKFYSDLSPMIPIA